MSLVFRRKLSEAIFRTIALILVMSAAAGLSSCGRGIDRAAMAEEENSQAEEQSVEYIYGIPMDESAGVVSSGVADVYTSPDVKSARVTQALYNQPVSIIRSENGWAEVKTVNGGSGWVKSKNIVNDVSSIYGRIYTYKIVVTSKEKVITSNPSGGATRMVAPMGSELYAFNSFDDAYEVFLPGNKTGWLKGSGVIRIGLDEMIPVTNADDFAATALRLKGTSFMLNGMSFAGIDAPGLVYISARINGINLPGTVEGQFSFGTEIKPEDARTGDLVFLAGTGDEESGAVKCVGICIGGGSYLYAGRKIGYVAIGDINRENSDGIVVAARRIFNDTSD